jgi:fucose 4-O-acetylase-like acetyltransferase
LTKNKFSDVTKQGGGRIGFIDLLKGFVTLLVVWGHSIENFKNGIDFWHNPVWEYIYSFHMPLFYMLSGFLFPPVLSLSFKEFIRRKSIQLLLPYFSWLVLLIPYRIITGIQFNWTQELKGLLVPFDIHPWFLRELFISWFVVYVSLRILKKWYLALAASLCFVLTAPYFFNLQRFLLPMFWVGVALSVHYQFIVKHSAKIIFASMIIFGICLVFWNGDYTIYRASFPPVLHIKQLFKAGVPVLDFTNWTIALFRFLTGVSGGITFFCLAQKFYRKNKLCKYLAGIGKYSMGIYILHIYLLYKFLGKIINFPNTNEWIYSMFFAPIISLLVVIICIFICKLIHKNKTMELMLFGRSQ